MCKMSVLDTIYTDFNTMIAAIVIKYNNRASENETVDSRRTSDYYIAAKTEQDSFHSYISFYEQAIINAGITNLETVRKYALDKNLIPLNKRQAVLLAQRKIIIDNYEEKNNYYRMMAGLPDLTDFTEIFVDSAVCTQLVIPQDLPIYQYDKDAISKLEKTGELDKIRQQYPDKEYLNYLGDNAIDIVQARTSKNFSVLRASRDVTDTFYDEFSNIYEQCREYFMTVIYNKSFGSSYTYYDNYIAMMIMVMTLQRIIVNTFKYGIEDDFYDLGSIQLLFSSYNVPFIQNLPIDYQRILVRNLNNLLRYKSTDKVLYDISSLLGFERLKIYKYFLIKERKMDINNLPVTAYQTLVADDGTTTTELDYDQMYNLFFQAVELKDTNLALALTDTSNRIEYERVVVEDPYWWDDDPALKQNIYETEFNFMETKYLNMNIMYKLTEMLFEVIYVFRMLIDKKDEVGSITITVPKLFEDKEINLFNVTALLCALISKKSNMVGNIISTPSKTLSIMGFNFYADFDSIKQWIKDNPKTISQDVLTYLQNLTIFGPNDVNKLYSDIKALSDFLIERMSLATDLDSYHAYRKLYDTLMVTQNVQTLFTKSDGNVADTFLEYLMDADTTLGLYVQSIDPEQIGDAVDHILTRLNLLMTDLKYLFIINDANNVLLDAVITLIRFFKSYTTDLTSFNIIYLMDSRYYNMVRLITDLKFAHANISHSDPKMLLTNEAFFSGIIRDSDQFKSRDEKRSSTSSFYFKDDDFTEHKLQSVSKSIMQKDSIVHDYTDDVKTIQKTLGVSDKQITTDRITLIWET